MIVLVYCTQGFVRYKTLLTLQDCAGYSWGYSKLTNFLRSKTLHVLDLSQFTATNEVMDSQVGATSRFSWWKTAVHAMLAAPLLPELFPRLQTPLPSEIVKFFSDLIRHTLGSIIWKKDTNLSTFPGGSIIMQQISPFGGRSSGKPKTQLPSGSFWKLGSMLSAVNTSFIIILNLTVKPLPTSCNPSGSSNWCCDRIIWTVLCCVWLDSKNLLFLAKETSYGLSMTKLPANLKHNKHIDMTKYVWNPEHKELWNTDLMFFLPYENNLISECRNLEPGFSGHPGDDYWKKTDPLMGTNTPSIDIEIGNER